MLDLRIEQREGRLVRLTDYEAMIDGLCGIVRTELSGLPARVGLHDLAVRRRAETICRETLVKMSEAASKRADQLEGRKHADADDD